MSDSVGRWGSISEAAVAAGTTDRTISRWINAGVVQSKTERRGQRDVRLIDLDSLPPTDGVGPRQTAPPDTVGQPSDNVGPEQTAADTVVNGLGLTDSRHESAPLGCECCRVRESENEHLRMLLQQRTDAERELRLIIARALPDPTVPALEAANITPVVPAARVRWWNPATWRNGRQEF